MTDYQENLNECVGGSEVGTKTHFVSCVCVGGGAEHDMICDTFKFTILTLNSLCLSDLHRVHHPSSSLPHFLSACISGLICQGSRSQLSVQCASLSAECFECLEMRCSHVFCSVCMFDFNSLMGICHCPGVGSRQSELNSSQLTA